MYHTCMMQFEIYIFVFFFFAIETQECQKILAIIIRAKLTMHITQSSILFINKRSYIVSTFKIYLRFIYFFFSSTSSYVLFHRASPTATHSILLILCVFHVGVYASGAQVFYIVSGVHNTHLYRSGRCLCGLFYLFAPDDGGREIDSANRDLC